MRRDYSGLLLLAPASHPASDVPQCTPSDRHDTAVSHAPQPWAPPPLGSTSPAMWIPMVEEPTVEGHDSLQYRGDHSGYIEGHLKPGVTPAQATEDLNNLGAWLAKAYPGDDEGVKLTLARPGLLGDMLGGPARA